MGYINRLTDPNDGGGEVLSTKQTWFTVDGQPVATDGDSVSSHPPCPVEPIHCEGNCFTANGATWFTIDGIPVNRDGDADNCGHVRVSNQHWFDVVG